MTSIFDIYEFWLTADDLQGKAHDVEVVRAQIREIYNPKTHGKDRKVAIWFKGRKMGMLLNPTQARELYKITGTPEFEKWVGAKVIILKGTAFGGKETIKITTTAPIPGEPTPAPARAKPYTAKRKEADLQRGAATMKAALGPDPYEQSTILLEDQPDEAYKIVCDALKYSEEKRKQILTECEGDYRTAAERLLEQHKAFLIS